MTDINNAFVTVMIKDMNASIKFYTETLGLKLKIRYENHFAEIEAPGMVIALHPSGSEIKKGENLSIAFAVNDIDKSVAAYEKKGVTFKMYDDEQVRLAFFTDPDGNTLYLAQSMMK